MSYVCTKNVLGCVEGGKRRGSGREGRGLGERGVGERQGADSWENFHLVYRILAKTGGFFLLQAPGKP